MSIGGIMERPQIKIPVCQAKNSSEQKPENDIEPVKMCYAKSHQDQRHKATNHQAERNEKADVIGMHMISTIIAKRRLNGFGRISASAATISLKTVD